MHLRDQLRTGLGDAYVVERELGGGGMSRVFLARETALGREVVIKILSPELAAGVSAERFAREARVAAGLQHPHIVPVLAAGEVAGLPYYTMPYVEGESLRERIARGPMLLAESLSILRDVALALEFAHAHRVVHRDIKPENILLAGSSAAVTDFGIAKAIRESRTAGDAGEQTLTATGISLGTPAYMAPEQGLGDAVDRRADVYAWGVVAYELVVGAHPFAHAKTAQQLFAAHINEPPPPLLSVAPNCPPQLALVIMKCLEKHADARPPNAGVLVAALEASSVRQFRSDDSSATIGRWTHGRRAVALVLVLAMMGVAATLAFHVSRVRWAREQAIPEIEKLAQAGRFEDAYSLATRAQSLLPADTAVAALLRRVSGRFVLTSEPVGAQVLRKPYDRPEADWRFVGITPLDTTTIPSGWSRLRIEKADYHPYEIVAGFAPSAVVHLTPERPADQTPEMVTARGVIDPPRLLAELGDLPIRTLETFEFARFEVTNQEYKRFVEAGGYRRRELWDSTFVRAGRPIPWSNGMAAFVDKTGLPGPATWQQSDFPSGEGSYPVSGVSWYEAAAYARFAGRQLPTVYHWMLAASLLNSFRIVPFSNIQGKKLAPVGEFQGMSGFGAFDVAGNVREWCLNVTGTDRFILGGAWDDDRFAFYRANHQDPFDRSPGNGIRLARYARSDTAYATLVAPIKRRARDFVSDRAASNAEFAIYRRQYDYDRTPLDARIERVDTTELWVRERVNLAAAYNGERLIAYLFLPRRVKPPYQTVVQYPGTDAIAVRSMPPTGYNWVTTSIVRGGRAALLPVYKSTYERGDSLADTYPNASNYYRDHVIMWAKDLRRAVDYLYSRPDIDTSRVAYTGHSWGGYLAGIMLAIEPRFKVAEITCGGLWFEQPQPEVNPINFLSRVKVPVLLVAGRYDANFPLEISQVPFLRLFGTPAAEKRHILVDAGHCPPPAAVIGETQRWFDQHLGAPR